MASIVGSFNEQEAVAEKKPTVFNDFVYDTVTDSGALNLFDDSINMINTIKSSVNIIKERYSQLQDIYDEFTDYNPTMDGITRRMDSYVESVEKEFKQIIDLAKQTVESLSQTDTALMDDLDSINQLISGGSSDDAGFNTSSSVTNQASGIDVSTDPRFKAQSNGTIFSTDPRFNTSSSGTNQTSGIDISTDPRFNTSVASIKNKSNEAGFNESSNSYTPNTDNGNMTNHYTKDGYQHSTDVGYDPQNNVAPNFAPHVESDTVDIFGNSDRSLLKEYLREQSGK